MNSDCIWVHTGREIVTVASRAPGLVGGVPEWDRLRESCGVIITPKGAVLDVVARVQPNL